MAFSPLPRTTAASCLIEAIVDDFLDPAGMNFLIHEYQNLIDHGKEIFLNFSQSACRPKSSDDHPENPRHPFSDELLISG